MVVPSGRRPERFQDDEGEARSSSDFRRVRWRRARVEVTHLTIEETRAGVTPAAAATTQAQPLLPDAAQIADAVHHSLDDSKAEDIVVIDIREKSSLADIMVVASGRSHRHVGAIADRLIEDLDKAGVHAPRVEGLPHCDWVLIDAGDVLVHVFRPEVRGFYALERMWASEPMGARPPSRG